MHSQEQDKIDENTSDDSLIMSSNFEERAPLLNINDDDLLHENTNQLNDIPLRIHLSQTHCHVPEQKLDHTDKHRLIIVLILCVVFMLIEIFGGILSNSTAIITDAAHMCVDATSFIISLAAIYLAKKQPTNRLSFGYIRAGRNFFVERSMKYCFQNFLRGSRCTCQYSNDLAGDWYSCLYGYRSLYQSNIRSSNSRNDYCCFVWRSFQYNVGKYTNNLKKYKFSVFSKNVFCSTCEYLR